MGTIFRFDLDELKEIQTELNELIQKIEDMNNNADKLSGSIINSGVPEEHIAKIFEVIQNEMF